MFIRMRERKAFTLVEIMIVVAIIGLLVAIAVPNFVRARRTARTNLCMNNLRIIDHAKEQWALENGAESGDAAGDLSPYVKDEDPTRVFCPLSGAGGDFNGYTIGAIGTSPSDNNYDATTHPAQL